MPKSVWVDKGAKFKKQSQDKTSTIAKTMVSPLYHSFEFAVLFYCFKVGFHCSLLCDATLCLVQASFAMSVID